MSIFRTIRPHAATALVLGGCLLLAASCAPSLAPSLVPVRVGTDPTYDQIPPTPAESGNASGLLPGAQLPAGFVFGPGDVISVVFWREKELSSEVSVQPDGNITLPLINEIPAAGRTPEEVRLSITEAADKFVTDPTVSVVVRQINSRRVYITGEVGKPGPYALTGPTTVLQMLAIAGGVNEYAKENDIVVVRTEDGFVRRYPFRFRDVLRGRNLRQNIELKPGDTIVVP